VLFGNDGSSGTTSGGLETDGGLEGIVDPPLETGEGTDHEDTGSESSPETGKSDLSVDLAHVRHEGSLTLGGVDLGHHGVGGVGDDGAEDTGHVPGHEGNSELLGLGVLILGFGEHLGVEHGGNFLESDELHDGVRDLSSPEGGNALIETTPTLVSLQLTESGSEVGGEGTGGGSLHSNLDGLPGTEESVGDNFGTTRSN